MSSVSISTVSFNLNALNDQVYELTIQFCDDEAILSRKNFTIISQHGATEGTLWDVYTKNGVCGPPKNNYLSRTDKKMLKYAAQLTSFSSADAFVGVVDFKEPHTGYLPCSQCESTIAICEEAVCGFFQKKEADLNFVINEGSLKMALLQNGDFSDRETVFLNSAQGAKDFCQCAEFFMNGFKLGGKVYSPQRREFSADQFIKPVSKKYTIFQPYAKSTVFYPPIYKEMYSPSGKFAQALQTVFAVSGQHDSKSKVTTLNVERKK